ncbi:hypothetical protein [Sphingomonas crocodyli]|uniref:Uncharacterized protein n=1 Tax=Sphingomonas crocodyli TaxID=1979270 RepID=A0A437M0H6_9SPHN|nr:hypothetical protein [Sphingomonas crocodyli]RVT91103.1 hypothetical protein EOD43_16405 [Sphingomonas crocodyli]
MRHALTSFAFAAIMPLHPAAATIVSKADIAGSWEEDPGTCHGGSHVVFSDDGSLHGYDFEGRWSLKGDRLTTIVVARMIGPEERIERVSPPETKTTVIVSASPGRRGERSSDGSLHHFHRCP